MSFYSEFYVVDKTIEVVVKLKVDNADHRIRIDALREDFVSPVVYSTKAYLEEHVTLQPTYPANNNGPTSKPVDFRVWVNYDLPWTHRDSADGALRQALSFLSERCVEP